MFFSLKADTTANDKEATAYQSGAVEDQMGPAPHHTEAAADLAKAATDQTGAAADQIGAPAVQTEASADQAALVDHLLKNTSSFDGKESFQDLKDNLSKYACGAGGANNGTEALSEVKEIILII